MKKILILGSEGFIGKNLVKLLSNKKYIDLHCISRNKVRNKTQLNLLNFKILQKYILDLSPDVIINLASAKNGSKGNLKKINYDLPKFLIQTIYCDFKMRETRLILFGSAMEYKSKKTLILETDTLMKKNTYSETKILQSRYFLKAIKKFKTNIILIRPFNVVGEDMSAESPIIDIMKKIIALKHNDKLKTGKLDIYRDFIDVKDLCRAIYLLIKKGKRNQIYNVCSGKRVLMKNIVKNLLKFQKKKNKIEQSLKISKGVNVSVGSANKIFRHTGWKSKIDSMQTMKSLILKLRI